MANLGSLLDALRRGEMPALGPDDVERLTGWLCDATRRAGDAPNLPRPDHDPVLQQMVFFRLDATLFDGPRLRLNAAGLGPDQSADRRKNRFRRLASAFHPDRNPAMADWLTTRSQIVLEAYARFKENPGQAVAPEPVPPRPDPPPNHAGTSAYGRTRRQAPGGIRRLMFAMRRRFGHDRFLAHKLIAALALIALLPVLNLWLAPDPLAPNTGTKGTESTPIAASTAETGASRTDTDRDPAGLDANRNSAQSRVSDAPADAGSASALRRAAREAMTLSQETSDPAAPLTPVDRQLEALGLASDQDRLYQRMSRSANRPEPASTAAAEARPASAANAPEQSPRNRRSGERTPTPAATASTAETAPEVASNSSEPKIRNRPATTAPSRPPATDAPAAPELEPGELLLGPLTNSVPGLVLAGFKRDLERGSLVGIASRFAPDVRHGPLNGIGAVTEHYRDLIDAFSQRRVDLRARRMRRDGDRWQVEVELIITGLRSGEVEAVRDGYARFVIGPHGDRIGILRLDS